MQHAWGKLELHTRFEKELVKETGHLGDPGDRERKKKMETNFKETWREIVKLDSVNSAGLVTGCCENGYEHAGSEWRGVY